MKKTLLLSLLLALCSSLSVAQVHYDTHSFTLPRKAEITVSAIQQDFFPKLTRLEKPVPGGITSNNNLRAGNNEPKSAGAPLQNTSLDPMGLGQNFFGNAFANGTPNDNDVAISNGGKIISVINSTLFFYDLTTDTTQGTISYSAFTAPLGLAHEEFDPKVMYDPAADRFITVVLNGYTDSTNNVIVGFSQTNDPTGTWNLYSLPGNPLNNTLWTDYPIMALSNNELFITANLLYNDSSWQTGFVESIIWQVNKQSGYSGASLNANLINNITFNNRAIRNLCPVKGGSMLYGPEMFLVSNRNFQTASDTVFLVKVGDTIGGPGFNIDIKQLNLNNQYFMAGDARQQGAHRFATNDSRILGAFIENNKIQFVSNSKDTASGYTAFYHGIISDPFSATPVATGQVVSDSLLDLGYPNISYAGSSPTDHTAIISFNHVSPTVHAGCSAIKTDGAGNYSPILKIKDGTSYVNLLSGSLERWGDYSGSQRRYNNPGEVWMSGYYGYFGSMARKHGAWVAQLLVDAPPASVNEAEVQPQVSVYPNPTVEFIQVEFTLTEGKYLHFELYDQSGRRAHLLMRELARPGVNRFSFAVNDLAAGIYFLKIHDGKKDVAVQKVVKN
jgi:hypothetical protein